MMIPDITNNNIMNSCYLFSQLFIEHSKTPLEHSQIINQSKLDGQGQIQLENV